MSLGSTFPSRRAPQCLPESADSAAGGAPASGPHTVVVRDRRPRTGCRRAASSIAAADERGNIAINTAVVFPMVLLIAMLLLMAGRTVLAQGAVQSAANEAARSASISRTAESAHLSASQTALSTLNNSGISCSSMTVSPALDAFALPLGTVGEVRVDVSCVVPLSDLGLPGAPGAREMHATGRSVLDAYRGRG